MKSIKFPFYEIIKNYANGYECGRERCDDLVTAYIRFSTLMNVFPEYTIKMNFVTEKEIHTVMQFPVRSFASLKAVERLPLIVSFDTLWCCRNFVVNNLIYYGNIFNY